MWMNRVSVFGSSGDTKAKRAPNRYGYALYAVMDEPYQKTTGTEIMEGLLSLIVNGENTF